MSQFISERNKIVSKLMNEKSSLTNQERDFLINYFQFHKEIDNTYVYYPLEVKNQKITFKKRRLFGKNSVISIDKILQCDIVGMLYFYAKFKKDMTFAASEKLSVNIFLNNPDTNISDITGEKNLAFINSTAELPSLALKRICDRYLAQPHMIVRVE